MSFKSLGVWFCLYFSLTLANAAELKQIPLFQQAQKTEQQGDIKKALVLYQQLLTQLQTETTPDKQNIALISFLMGNLYKQQLQYAEAETLLQQSLTLREQLFGENHLSVAVSLNSLAELYFRLANYAQAEQFWQRCLTIAPSNNPSFTIYLNNLGELYRTQGDYAQAEILLKRALTLDEQRFSPQSPTIAIRLNNLAEIYRLTGRYNEAEQLLKQALSIDENAVKQKELEEISLAIRYNNLGQLYRSIANYKEAERYYRLALTLWQKSLSNDHPLIAAASNNLAWILQLNKDYNQALILYQTAFNNVEKRLGKNHPDLAIYANNLGLLYLEQQQLEKATIFLNQAMQLWEQQFKVEQPQLAFTLVNLAKLAMLKQDEKQAELLLQRALAIAARANQPELSWKIFEQLMLLFKQQKQFNLAIFFGKQAINTLQQLRTNLTNFPKELQNSFLQDKIEIYRQLADLLMSQGRLAEAQQVLAMLKQEEFFDFVRRDQQIDDIKITVAALTDKEQRWYQEISTLNQQLAKIGEQLKNLQRQPVLNPQQQLELQKLRAEADATLNQINLSFNQLKQDFSQQAQINDELQNICQAESQLNTKSELNTQLKQLLDKLNQQLNADSPNHIVIVHYVMLEHKLRMIVSSATQQFCRESLINRTELNSLINDFRLTVQNPNRRVFGEAKQLYQIVFAPFAKELEQMNTKMLMLSLEGNLRYLPIAALFDGQHYVAEKYQLALFSDVAQNQITETPQTQWKIAGFGLTKAVKDFNPLPAVQKELEGIISQNDKDKNGALKGIILLNEQFNRKKLEEYSNADFPVVHIASHFIFKAGSDEDSFLLLGDGSELTLADVRKQYHFNKLDLLTLSACETALGSQATGREIEGLAGIAQRQGANSVLATLWAVNDESTAAFMQRLYHVHTQGLSKAAAIQQVQQAFINARRITENKTDKQNTLPIYFEHPYYWSPFVLMGNWL